MEKIKQLEQEKENYEFLAEGLVYEHQQQMKHELLIKAENIKEEIKELKDEYKKET